MTNAEKIAADQSRTSSEKFADALRFLGTNWVMDKSRHIPRGSYEPEVIRTNLAETFARVRKRFTGSVETQR